MLSSDNVIEAPLLFLHTCLCGYWVLQTRASLFLADSDTFVGDMFISICLCSTINDLRSVAAVYYPSLYACGISEKCIFLSEYTKLEYQHRQ